MGQILSEEQPDALEGEEEVSYKGKSVEEKKNIPACAERAKMMRSQTETKQPTTSAKSTTTTTTTPPAPAPKPAPTQPILVPPVKSRPGFPERRAVSTGANEVKINAWKQAEPTIANLQRTSLGAAGSDGAGGSGGPGPGVGNMKREGSLNGSVLFGRSVSATLPPMMRSASQPLVPGGTEASYALLDTDQFHASWSNSAREDLLGQKSLVMDRPMAVSRVSSSQSRATSIGEQNGISSVIHDAARITNWHTVKELCETAPEAARYVGRDRWTALHHACNRRCPQADVVEALIKASPEALLLEEDKGWLPLHYACRFKCTKDVVRLLLNLYPKKGAEAVSRVDRQGRTPLYYAVRYDAPPGVVGLLLEVDASAVLEEDQNADSPLALVWDAWAEKLEGKRTLQSLYVPSSEAEGMSPADRANYAKKRLQSQKKLLGRWNKINIFLKAAFGFKVDEDSDEKDKKVDVSNADRHDRKWRVMHAAAAIKCHPSLFVLASALHPEQARERDQRDLRGPPHVCVGCQQTSEITALHFAAASQANGEAGKMVISQLLALNPDAASAVDANGSVPLHMLVENKDKNNWIVDGGKELFAANERAVYATDNDGRLPLHRAAQALCHNGEGGDTEPAKSVLLNLLVANPDGAGQADNFGCLPIHLAVQNCEVWDNQLESLHETFATATRVRTGVKLGNSLPLHMGCSNPDAKFSLIKRLVELNPRGASQANRNGRLPLHLACESGLSWKSVNEICNAYTGAVQQTEQNSRGWTCLHMAANSELASKELVANLVRLYPEAASMADTKGRYPLHLACLSGKGWDAGLSELFEAYPDAIRTEDSVGLLPLHIAGFRYCLAPKPPKRLSRPSVIKLKNRRLSRAVAIEAERAAEKEMEDAKRIEILFNLLKADPTIL